MAWVLLPLALGPDRARAATIGTGVLGVTVAASLLAGEMVVRAAFSDVTTTGENRGYFARRWQAGLPPENTLGYREREVSPTPAEGVFRVAVIGDSFTWGQGIDRADRVTDRLQRMLDETYPGRFEVLNFGRAGAETVDHIDTLRDVVLPLRPNFVLMQWYTNDVEGRDKSGRPTAMPLVPTDGAASWLTEHSALYYLMNDQWGRLQARLAQDREDYMDARFGDSSSPDMIAALDEVRAFISIARGAGVGLGIVTFPDPILADTVEEFPYGYLFDRVLAVCREEGIQCLDLRPAYLGIHDEKGLWASRLDHHPGPEANRVAAEVILAHFGDRWTDSAAGKNEGAGG